MDLLAQQKSWIEEWLARFAWDLEVDYLLSFSAVGMPGARDMVMGYHLFLSCKSPLLGQQLLQYHPFPDLMVGKRAWGDQIKKMVDELRITRAELLNGKDSGGP